MTSPERRSVAVGAELDRLNGIRHRRAQTMRARWFAQAGPADRARFLMDLAAVDARRRALRGLLGDQLSQIDLMPAEAAVPPRTDPWAPRGRHHAR